jgi:hypothetical protein
MKKNGKDLNPYESLDEILKFLTISPFAKQQMTAEQLLKLLTEKNSIDATPAELSEIVNQLIEDGFVKADRSDGAVTYSISFKGQMLNLKGGYDHLSRDQERLYHIEIAHQKTEKKIFYMLIILAIGATIASVFYLLRIFNLIPPAVYH